jgi:hypothetical protein
MNAQLSTRPDAHSAKSARRAGALNHLQGSGEEPMVGNESAPDSSRGITASEALRLLHRSDKAVGR